MSWTDCSPVDIDFTPSATAYSSGDVVGGLHTLNMPTTRGLIVGVTVSIGEASIAVPGTIYIYNGTPTTFADNAAWAPVHADNILEIGSILLPTAVTKNTRNTYKIKYGGSTTAPLELIEFDSNTLYAYYVTSGTPDFAASQTVRMRFHVIGEK